VFRDVRVDLAQFGVFFTKRAQRKEDNPDYSRAENTLCNTRPLNKKSLARRPNKCSRKPIIPIREKKIDTRGKKRKAGFWEKRDDAYNGLVRRGPSFLYG
jgi:hypothetical protein